MLRNHDHMWSGHLEKVTATLHRIELNHGARPVRQHSYRQGPKGQHIIEAQVNKMLADGVITPTASEWSSPVVLAPKSDGSLRLCVDYRKLNALSVKDSYPISRIDE